MFSVTSLASEQIAKYFEGKKVSPIRIFYSAGG